MRAFIKFLFFYSSRRLSFSFCKCGGRNFFGRICVYHKGGSKTAKGLFLDRLRRVNQCGVILKVFKITGISAFLGLILYNNGLATFISLSEGTFLGSYVFSGVIFKESSVLTYSSCLPLKNFSLLTTVNSVELFPFSSFKIARSAGTSAFIINKLLYRVVLKLASGWQYRVFPDSFASLGRVSNLKHCYLNLHKAGVNRGLGVRPTVRGVVKNPCDHPHGGGEGKGSPPVAQVTPWGRLTKGTPTNNRKFDRLRRRLFKFL
jgi:large subunit ribosomal protein L2